MKATRSRDRLPFFLALILAAEQGWLEHFYIVTAAEMSTGKR